MSPSLAGGFLSTVPPGKSWDSFENGGWGRNGRKILFIYSGGGDEDSESITHSVGVLAAKAVRDTGNRRGYIAGKGKGFLTVKWQISLGLISALGNFSPCVGISGLSLVPFFQSAVCC